MLDDYRKLSANSNMADYFSNTICDLQTVSLADDFFILMQKINPVIFHIFMNTALYKREMIEECSD